MVLVGEVAAVAAAVVVAINQYLALFQVVL